MKKTVGLTFTAISVLFVVLHSNSASSQLKIFPGDPSRGERVLSGQGCLNCHSLNGRGGTTASDLSHMPAHADTPEQLATTIWNHATLMWTTPSGIKRADMTSADSADMFAYLYSSLYFAPSGDADRGKAVFEARQCADCHAAKPVQGKVGPAMSEWAPLDDPIMLAERMWN